VTRRRARRKKHRGGLVPNLTPMVDVVFLLIIFFVLVAQITSAERIALDLPQVLDPPIDGRDSDRRVIVNIIPRAEAGPTRWAQVGTIEIPPGERGEARLAEVLAGARAGDPHLRVVIRAERTEPYDRVFLAMEACRTAGVASARLAATRADD